MAQTSESAVCRLVVVGPTRRVDVSVPIHVPLTDLMPAVLRSLGPELADRGLAHSGWILQRLGEGPLDEDRTMSDLAVVDGNVLHLRPRSDQIPPLDFDDLADGLSSGIARRPGAWRAAYTRSCGRVVAAVCLVTAFAQLFQLSGDVAWQAAVVLCGVQLLAAAGWVRYTADFATGLVLVLTSAGSAAAAGAIWSSTPHAPGADPLARAVVAAGLPAAVALGAGVALLAGRRQRLSWLCGPAAVGLLLVLCAGLAWVVGLHRVQLAAVLVLVSLGSRSLVPMLAFRLAGLRTPMLPASAEDIQQGIEPEPAAQVLERAARADLAMTMMHTALGLGSAVASIWLASAPGWAPWSTAVAASVAQLLVARPMTSAWQRMAVGLPGVTGLVAAVLAFPAGATVAWHLLAVVGLLALAALSVSIGRSIPERPLIPVWGRVGDLLLTVASVLVVPLALGACGVYGLIRGGGG